MHLQFAHPQDYRKKKAKKWIVKRCLPQRAVLAKLAASEALRPRKRLQQAVLHCKVPTASVARKASRPTLWETEWVIVRCCGKKEFEFLRLREPHRGFPLVTTGACMTCQMDIFWNRQIKCAMILETSSHECVIATARHSRETMIAKNGDGHSLHQD